MKKLGIALVAGAMLSATALTPSTAQANGFNGMNPWQQCGIGSYIFPSNGVASAISNIIWDLGTTAVISASVSPEACNASVLNTALLIDLSYDQLTMETAQGSGEHLTAALNLAGCEATTVNVDALRSDLNTVVGSADYADMSHEDKAFSFYSSLQNVAANCGA